MIEIDLIAIYQFFDQFVGLSAWEIIWLLLFKYWGWLIFIFIFLRFLAWPEYMFSRNVKWAMKQKPPVLLAIDVPKRNEQSIQAMENFFDHLLGAHGTFTKWAKYIEGEFQRSLSVELVSIEGNIQFLVRCPGDWRNLVEAAVYSQYPDAEITEVEDYTNSVPQNYPNETHDVWGVEFTLSGNKYLPIKTYPKFEHRFSEVFVDPMAALLETMSSVGPGEQIWIQYILTPLAVDWGKEGKKEIDKILGKPVATKKGILSTLTGGISNIASEFTEQLAGLSLTGEAKTEEKKSDLPSMMLHLSPGQKEQLEDIERKISKLAFNTKIRYVYVAEKDKMNKALGVNAVIGSIKQWTDMNLNGLKPDLKPTGTSSPQYILINYRRNSRKNKIMTAYKKRSTIVGSPAKPMCNEELASLWHFPSMYIKAPLLKKTEFTKAAAPVGLPMSEAPVETEAEKKKAEEIVEEAAVKAQVEPTFDYDSDEFEKQFAKDKKSFKESRSAREKRLKEIEKEEKNKLKEKQESEISAEEREDQKKESAENIPGNLPFID